MNTKTYVIASQKGGTGKTTTALALAAGLCERGRRVLSIDLDGQGSFTLAAGSAFSPAGGFTAALISGRLSRTLIRATPIGDVIPADPKLDTIDLDLPRRVKGRESRLKNVLAAIGAAYDAIVIDTPPALGTILVNALAAADAVIIPTRADYYSLDALARLWETIRAVKGFCNPTLRIAGILFTSFRARCVLERQLADAAAGIAAKMETRVFAARIRESIVIREAAMNRESLVTYAPRAKATEDYRQFLAELLDERKIEK